MVVNCPVCQKQLYDKRNLERHLEKKVCQKDQHKTCPKCSKVFSSKQKCEIHIKNGVCLSHTPSAPPFTTDTTVTTITHNYDTLSPQQLIAELQSKENEIGQLKTEVRVLKENPQTVNNNTININVPPAFLTPDNYEMLSKQLPKLLHNALSKHPNNFISYLIKETNCNPMLPLYNSVKLTNKKGPFIQVSDGKQFIYAPRKSTITQLIENKRDILQRYVNRNGDKYGEKILKKYHNYITYLDEGGDEGQKDLEVEISSMLLNVSDVIGSDDWSKRLLDGLKVWEQEDS